MKNKDLESLLKEFEEKWRQDPTTGFLKPTLHIDDIRELIERILKRES